jgi:hypothetical protein
MLFCFWSFRALESLQCRRKDIKTFELLVCQSLLLHSKPVTCGIKIKAKLAINNLPKVILDKRAVGFYDLQQHMSCYCVLNHETELIVITTVHGRPLQSSHVLYNYSNLLFQVYITLTYFRYCKKAGTVYC